MRGKGLAGSGASGDDDGGGIQRTSGGMISLVLNYYTTLLGGISNPSDPRAPQMDTCLVVISQLMIMPNQQMPTSGR